MDSSSYKHLQAWRLHRGLTQEETGDILGVAHTTIGRWEKGPMELSMADLRRLAAVYSCSLAQLLAPPAQAALVAQLDETQQILGAMSPDVRDEWLALGRRLSGLPKPPPSE